MTAFRRKPGGALELRALEVEGRPTEAEVVIHLPCGRAAETDLLGVKRGEAELTGGKLRFRIGPWQIRTFEIA